MIITTMDGGPTQSEREDREGGEVFVLVFHGLLAARFVLPAIESLAWWVSKPLARLLKR